VLAFVKGSSVIPRPAEKQPSHLMRRGLQSFRRALYGVSSLLRRIASTKVRVAEQPLEILGRGRLTHQPLPANRMLERDAPGMKRLSRKGAQHGRECVILDTGPERLPIFGVADDRPSARCKMDADLVRSASLEATAEQ
jgi:hypothetical protein